MELIAAISGSIYLSKTKEPEQAAVLCMKFLYSVLIIDLLGGYAGLAYFDNYEHFSLIKDTPFVRNEWYYNIAQVYFISMYSYLIRLQIEIRKFRKILKYLLIGFIVFCIINFFTSDHYFTDYLISNYILGSFLILTTVCLYFYEMLLSNKVLSFYKNLYFYISVGIVLNLLMNMPINIYNTFVNQENDEFVKVFLATVRYSNILMYTLFAVGFYLDYKNRDPVKSIAEI